MECILGSFRHRAVVLGPLGLDLWLVPLVAGFDATETYGIHAIIQLVMRCPWTPQMLYR